MKVVKGIIIETQTPLTLNELAHAMNIRVEIVVEMVENHLVMPSGKTPEDWAFDDVCFKRVKRAVSFHQDLEINLPGIAMALDLIDKIEHLETQIETLKKLTEKP